MAVYPTLAIVENPTPAAYEAVESEDNDATPAAVPSAGDEAAAGDDGAAEAAGEEPVAAGPPKPVTASIRRTYRLLRAANGWRGNFRGILLAIIITTITSIVAGSLSFIPFVQQFVGNLVAQLVLVQLNAAWVHTVMRANPSSVSLWRSLPPFRRTFEATCIPTFLLWLANAVIAGVSVLIANALHLPTHLVYRMPADAPAYSVGLMWKTLIIVLVALALSFLLVIPATIMLVRVQASLFPPEEDTIVSFDRSFSGTVEPAVVGGRGYVTLRDAFRTFTRASWKRVTLLYVKVYLIGLGVQILYAAILLPLSLLTRRMASPGN